MSVEPTGSEQKAIELLREQGGTLRTSEALCPGSHACTLYALHDDVPHYPSKGEPHTYGVV
jgi:hypothetical protein